MRRLLIPATIIAVLIGAGVFAFDRYKIYLPGLISRVREPIGKTQAIVWEAAPGSQTPAAERPPNVIVILADDLGFNDITFFGGGVAGGRAPTPNIDAIGRDGVSFDTAYAANATCSPSRAAIMTGRYPTRFGFEFTAAPVAFARNIAHFPTHAPHAAIYHSESEAEVPPLDQLGVPASEVTIAEVLQARGYHTMHIGKWHLGESAPLQPNAQGFDESLAILTGAGMFLPANDPGVVNAKLPWDPIDQFLWANLPYAVRWNGGRRFAPEGYITDYFTDQAVAAIEANRNRPFFLYLAYNAPHTPLQAARADYDALSGIEDHTLRVYAAMIMALDRGVGRVMQALKQNGLDENTLVIFTSDNGGAWYVGLPDLNKPYRGWKATFFEGGVRVPFFMRWPARIPAGTRSAAPAGHMDIFATAARAAGAEPAQNVQRDSVDLTPFALANPPAVSHAAMFWRSGHYRVVRAGDWKLQVSERPERAWLFNLAADPTEQNDLSAQQPERVAQMRALIDAHEQGMPRPLWPALIEGPVRIDVPLNTPWTPDQEYVYWAN
jgi:arylsulfatase A-like enzyme